RKGDAAGGLFEGEGDGMFDVVPALGRRAAAGAASCAGGAAASTCGLAEELFEDVAEAAGVAEIEIFDGDVGSGLPLAVAAGWCATLAATELVEGIAEAFGWAGPAAADAG